MKAKHREKPLVEMSRSELDSTFDELGKDLHVAILRDARAGKGQDIILALGILTLADGSERLAFSDTEYGDGEGIRVIDDDVSLALRLHLLEPGEQLRREVVKVVRYVKQDAQ